MNLWKVEAVKYFNQTGSQWCEPTCPVLTSLVAWIFSCSCLCHFVLFGFQWRLPLAENRERKKVFYLGCILITYVQRRGQIGWVGMVGWYSHVPIDERMWSHLKEKSDILGRLWLWNFLWNTFPTCWALALLFYLSSYLLIVCLAKILIQS